jgi:hypothetical protein
MANTPDPHDPVAILRDLSEALAVDGPRCAEALTRTLPRVSRYVDTLTAEGGILWFGLSSQGRFAGAIEITKAAFDSPRASLTVARALREFAAVLERNADIDRANPSPRPSTDLEMKVAQVIATMHSKDEVTSEDDGK